MAVKAHLVEVRRFRQVLHPTRACPCGGDVPLSLPAYRCGLSPKGKPNVHQFRSAKADCVCPWAVIIILAVVAVVFTALSLFGPSASERWLQISRFDRWLRARQTRTPKRLLIEIVALAIAVAVLITLFDYWLAGKLSPAILSVLTWGKLHTPIVARMLGRWRRLPDLG